MLVKKSKFWIMKIKNENLVIFIEILVKNRNFVWSKIEILYGQKSKFWSKIEILIKNRFFYHNFGPTF